MNDVEPFSKSNRGQYSPVSKEEAMQMYERSLIAEETRVLKDVNLPFYIGDLAQQGLLAPHHVRGLIYTLKYGRMEFQSTPRHFFTHN